MTNDFMPNAEKYISARQGRSRRHKLLTFLAVVVVFCTTYALILPAITLEKSCQLQEHTHTDACYTQLLPEPDSSAGADQIYPDEAPDTQLLLPELTCTLSEDEGHTHTERCYGVWELTCPLPEHTHTAQCRPAEDEPPAEDALPDEIPDELPAGDASAEDKLPAEDELPTEDELSVEDELPIEGELSPEEQSQLDTVSSLIDALPDAADLAEALDTLEAAGDPAALEDYYQRVLLQARSAYAQYQELSPDLQAQLANREKLLELEWLWGAETLNENFAFATPTEVESASTKDFIELNLYDYISDNDISGKESINKYYRDNTNLPGFQWNGGAYMASDTFDRHKVDYIDFGNSNITDIGYGGATANTRANGLSQNSVIVANKGGAINALDISTYGTTNRPIGMSLGTNVLSLTLKDDYPALADGTTSLKYLFTSGDYVRKKNTESIDGLFQYDEKTGAYYYNSRENHAQYSNNKFTLYDQIITPNFIVYPFGNFLPFNTITDSTKATQVSSIDGNSGSTVSDYVKKIQQDMSGSLSGSPTKTQLNTMLGKYKDDISGTTIKSARDAIVDYFTAGGGSGDKPSSDTSPITDDLLNKMYNIDWDEETNFFFGMEMKMSFFQPKGGLTGNDGQQKMVFYFTGDDDVWVYIDGVLFLDLSGIHRHVGGEIDFVNGKVYYYALDTEKGGDVSSTPYKTYTFAELLKAAGKSTDGLNENGTFKDYSTHSFNFYYMERGSGSSVCRMNFNFPLLKKNSISVTKELSVDDESKLPLLGNPDFKFQVLKEDAENTVDEKDLFIPAGTKYDILDTSGNKIGTGTTDADGVFTLKAGQTAVFSGIKENAGSYFVRELLDASFAGQYGEVSVNGSTITENYGVEIGESKFTGVNSPVQDVSNGSTVFRFDNNVKTDNLGSLSIQKTLTGYSRARAPNQFDFEVKLDDEPLPVGTKYTVGDVEKTVAEAGIITLAPDEIAVISNILAGTQFTVKETAASAEGYTVTYTVNGSEPSKAPASGTVGLGSTVAVIVNNAETGASVDIPVQKTLLTPDGKEHTYQFTLTQVTDSSGQTPVENGLTETLDITVTVDPVTENFAMDYPFNVLDGESSKTFYYKIAEVIPENSPETIYDESVYIVAVTLTRNENDVLSAEITEFWKNGEEQNSIPDSENPIPFVNQLVRYELPQTGGPGTRLYTAGGLLLMFAAAVLLLCQHRHGKGARTAP